MGAVDPGVCVPPASSSPPGTPRCYLRLVCQPSLTNSRVMDLNQYQELAARTLGRERSHQQQLANAALGLAGEAGEVADTLKKHLYHAHPLDRDAVVKELGDCLWYVAAMATVLDVSLEEIGAQNIDKLRRRYPEGFSVERSLNRVEG